jgi:hypothetical protein
MVPILPGPVLFASKDGGLAGFVKGLAIETPEDLDQRRHQPSPASRSAAGWPA